MSGSGELDPPAEVRAEDPGAHQLAQQSDSEDQFTDAQSAPETPTEGSPVPTTRVDRVDDEPADGEVPGTDSYQLRQADAKPDQIAVPREEGGDGDDDEPSPTTPAATDIPITVVQEAPGETPGEHEHELEHEADAAPNITLSLGDDAASVLSSLAAPAPTGRRRRSSRTSRSSVMGDDDDADDFGDDFDDFEEGAEDDDFDDFEDGFQQPAPAAAAPAIQQTMLPYPIPDLSGLDSDAVMTTTEAYLASLFPPEELDVTQLPPLSKDSSAFTTPRSASLWSQLVAPPPLAPPDWIRSRTRRLFLVSLGVPVDLDEILPASKQKKLILPSLNIPSSASPRGSSDSRPASHTQQGQQGDANASSTSVDTQGKPRVSGRRRGPAPPPELDMAAARLVCTTTSEALDGMTDQELQAHVKRLEGLQGISNEALEYWKKRTDEKIAERDTFEGVIENLVKHARKVRK
ncbi:hypothetical protein GMORB2_6247 [Geosmithia morbida]|uniref:Uncharacterized protein n=1 Tax=Geosmithia morbida TaxID=1094350 RepID=A0A9P4YUW5_9HYPO|nr:uncharacterized protein GMORB2_6247 [Geosmithia morbida]KAF4123546.1 hypothetical protein GMORB2_6247 [Geosmithia morbida]